MFGQKWETLLVLFVSLEMDDLIEQYTHIRDKIPLIFLCVLSVCITLNPVFLLLHNHFPMLLKFFIKFYIYILVKKSQEIWALPIWITYISHLPLGFFINVNQRQHSQPRTF